ncbi:MAG: DUF2905 domain-containing protein [Bryobacterales bacterium]|nr:DUF2905 domain-containing protein [Bryobacterales bacterium]
MNLGRTLILVGLLVVAAGVLVILTNRLPFRLGQLPGDIVIRGKNSTIYLPLATCLVLSVIFSFVLWFFSRVGRR